MADVIVAGSINMDVVASVARHPRPGETVAGTGLRYFPGGKGANQAVAAARAGGSVRMLGAVGDDTFGEDLVRFLGEAGVDTRAVPLRKGDSTGTALVVLAADGENAIVVVPGANHTVDETLVTAGEAEGSDVFLSQYEIPLASVAAFFRRGHEVGATCVLNPAPATPTPPDLLALVDGLVLNETELATLSGAPITADSSEGELTDAIGELRSRGLSGAVVATLGRRGALAVVAGRLVRVAGHEVTAVDTTGAGDCFVGSLAAQLARGAPIEQALEYANGAAALCVTQAGAGPSMPSRDLVEALVEKRLPTRGFQRQRPGRPPS